MIGIQEPYFSVSSMGAISPDNLSMVFKLKLAALILDKYDDVIQVATEACNELTQLRNKINKL